ncbi:MAG: hypothetical protein ACK2UI_02860, partial [Anaerolineae bacterium]
MHAVPRRQLREIVAQYGESVLEDPRRCRALLLDFCGSYKGEINLLVMAMQESIPADLRNASPGIPQPVLFGRLIRRLQDAYFLPEDAARWAVETCAEALGTLVTEAKSRTFTSTLPVALLGRSSLLGDREWRELGTMPGHVDVLPDYEVRVSAYLDDAGLQTLAQELRAFGPIQELDLQHSPITDAGLAHVCDLPGLMSLDLSRTAVTDAGLALLQILDAL